MEYLGIAEMLITLLSIAVGFVYKTITQNIANNKEELNARVNKLEEVLQDDDTSIKDELSTRIDKFEENSRRDDDTVKELIKEAEGRMRGEIGARIRNIVEIHGKIEKQNETLTAKHEKVLERTSEIEGKLGMIEKIAFDSSKYKK
jgi:hypothetical protein